MKLYYYEFYPDGELLYQSTGFLVQASFEVIEYLGNGEVRRWDSLEQFKREMKYRSPRMEPGWDSPEGVAIVRIE